MPRKKPTKSRPKMPNQQPLQNGRHPEERFIYREGDLKFTGEYWVDGKISKTPPKKKRKLPPEIEREMKARRSKKKVSKSAIGTVHPRGYIESESDYPRYVRTELEPEQQQTYKNAFNTAYKSIQNYDMPEDKTIEHASKVAWRFMGVESSDLLKWMNENEDAGSESNEYESQEEDDDSEEEEESVEKYEPYFDEEYGLALSKADDEKKYTFSVVYKASGKNRITDAHNEFVTASELQKAQWGYVRNGDRSIYLQHQLTGEGNRRAGEWVDIVSWPYEVSTSLSLPVSKDGSTEMSKREVVIPADSVWMGVIWEDWAWDKVKRGEIRGFSLGGRTERKIIG